MLRISAPPVIRGGQSRQQIEALKKNKEFFIYSFSAYEAA